MVELFENSGESDQMPRSVASNLGLSAVCELPVLCYPDYNRLQRRTNIIQMHTYIAIKVKKDCLMKQRTHEVTKIGDSICLSLFICNTFR